MSTKNTASAPCCSLLWVRLLPFLRWWPRVTRETLRADLMAGLTNAVVVLPQGVAFALIAGLPPEYGLYTAIVTPVIAGLFGSSWHLISGPTTAISIVVFSTVSGFAEPGTPEYVRIALTLTLLAGAYQLAFGLARLGTLVNFVSHSVVVGFTAGAAILIATSQFKHVLGVPVARGESFLVTWWEILRQVPDTNFYVLAVAAVTLAVALIIRRWRPRWPGMLVAMVVGALLSVALSGPDHGVSLVGKLPAHLPPPSVPDLSWTTLRDLAPKALAVALLGLIEAVSIGRAIATRSGQRIDGNQEFMGQGLSNVVGSFFSAYAGSGSFTRSGINFTAGAQTPLSAVFAAVSLALILLLVAPLTAYLPIAAMGGIILLVAYNLIDFHHIQAIMRASTAEATVMGVTFFATLFLDLEFAIYAGVMLSLMLYLKRTSRPAIVSLVPDPRLKKRPMTNVNRTRVLECPQLKIARIDGSLFFGAVDHVAQTLQSICEMPPKQNHLLVLAEGINFMDVAGGEALVAEAKRLQKLGGGLYICGAKAAVRELLVKGSYLDSIGHSHLFLSKADALSHVIARLDEERCAQCQRRIFEECKSRPGATPVETAVTGPA